MLYAQFYANSPLWDYKAGNYSAPKLIEGCGDRSVIVYDGRLSRDSIMSDAKLEGAKRGYNAVALFMGDTFTRSSRITEIVNI